VLELTAPYASWLQRAADLNCFPSREDAANYLIAWVDGEVQLVREMLAAVLRSRRFNAEILSWVARPDEYYAAGRSADAPAMLTGLTEAELGLVTFANTRLRPEEYLDPDGSLKNSAALTMLSELGAAFALAEVSEKPDLAKALQDEVLATSGNAPLPVGRIVRAYVAALFLQKSAHSAALRRVAPLAPVAGTLAERLLERANGAGLAWAATFGPAAKLLPIDAVLRAESVTDIDNLLTRVHTRQVNNLVATLRCRADTAGTPVGVGLIITTP